MRNIIKLSSLLSMLYLLSGCKGDNTTQIIYTEGKPGTIIGKVTLIDTLPTALPIKDASGVEVSIEGTSFKTLTNNEGMYSFVNVPPGTYWLIFKKDDFATMHLGIVSFAGNGTDYFNEILYRMSHRTPILILRPFDSTGNATYTFKVLDSLQKNESASGYIFFGKTDMISPSDPSSYLYMINVSTYLNVNELDFLVQKISFLRAGFSPLEKIFCVVYTGNASSHFDLASYKNIYTGFSPYHSEIKNFILP